MSMIHLSYVPLCFCQTGLIFVYLRWPDMKSHLIWQQTTVSSAEGLHVLIYLVSNRGQWMLMTHDTFSGPSSPPISSLITHMSSLLYHILLLPRIHFPVGSLLLPLMPTLLLSFFQHLWFLPFLSLLLPPVCPLCMVVTGWGSSPPLMSINGTSACWMPSVTNTSLSITEGDDMDRKEGLGERVGKKKDICPRKWGEGRWH